VTDSAGPLREDGVAISIVIATYNRPAVLAYAIRSVLAQDFADWELIVVGDRCSEATDTLMASFVDERIRYVNLALNTGEQSGPNNVGIARAQGRYIAFLNHDDLWFPDHLRSAMDWLQASGADGVIARSASIMLPPQPDQASQWYTSPTGIGRAGRYDPLHTLGPASTLLLKSSVARAVAPWRPASECYFSSSQEWLFRIWKRGFQLRTVPHLTVMQIASGGRPGSYLGADNPEHAFFAERLNQPLELRLLLLDRHRQAPTRPLWRRLAKSIVFVGLRAAAHLGFAPCELIARFVLGRRRGSVIDELRGIRGLSSLPERDPSAAALRARYAREQGADG